MVGAILRGDYSNGGKLPTEAQLAQHFAVSRPTVREALSRLRADGLVQARRGSGSYVVRAAAQPPASTLPLRSIGDIERYYAFRSCLECGAAAAAAEMRGADDLRAIRTAFDAVARALRRGGSGIDEDMRLHHAIARASHNPYFVEAIEHGIAPVRQFMEFAGTAAVPDPDGRLSAAVQREHEAVIDAIARSAPVDAAAAMRVHLFAARARIFEHTPAGARAIR